MSELVSQRLIDRVKKFEGYTDRATWDYKQYSIGYGTRARHKGEKISRDEAERRLRSELTASAKIVDSVAPNVPEVWRDRLVSLTYNAGSRWAQEGLGDAIERGDYKDAGRRFMQYNKAGGNRNRGLAKRRFQEMSWGNTTDVSPRFNPDAPEVVIQDAERFEGHRWQDGPEDAFDVVPPPLPTRWLDRGEGGPQPVFAGEGNPTGELELDAGMSGIPTGEHELDAGIDPTGTQHSTPTPSGPAYDQNALDRAYLEALGARKPKKPFQGLKNLVSLGGRHTPAPLTSGPNIRFAGNVAPNVNLQAISQLLQNRPKRLGT